MNSRREQLPDARDTVSIRPGVGVLSVLRSLNYQPWFALGEFVDNSVQSFLDRRAEIEEIDGSGASLKVSIDLEPADDGRLTVRDSAGGIAERDFPRAFRPAQLPPDRSGLSEFGIGMKSAACWFAPLWEVRTSALGEPVERLVRFDIAQIVRDEIEELEVEVVAQDPAAHFTEIVLKDLHRRPVGRTLHKIKEHLTDIYRVFIREGLLTLEFRGDSLSYQGPAILVAPAFDSENRPQGEPMEWRKDLSFDFGRGLKATGFAALREQGSTTHAGFSLFRRKRLIVGSGDEKYRPQRVFGTPNDYVYQRLFGELQLEGFQVSHTKDGFQWDENEEPFLEVLKEHLEAEPKPLLRQARNYRSRQREVQFKTAADKATERTANALKETGPPVFSEMQRSAATEETPPELPGAELVTYRAVDLDLEGRRWRVVLELSNDPAVGDLVEVSDSVVTRAGSGYETGDRETLGVRVSLAHSFITRFAGADHSGVEALLRVFTALAIAEKLARESGVKMAGAVRANMNRILHDVL